MDDYKKTSKEWGSKARKAESRSRKSKARVAVKKEALYVAGEKKVETVWFARGGGVTRMGPFKTQIEATNALRLAPQKFSNKIFPDDAFVWPEKE